MANYDTVKKFVFIYAIFTAILLFFGIGEGAQLIKEIPIPEKFTYTIIFEALNLVISFANFILTLLVYSIPGQTFLNFILWGYRIVMIIELIRFIRDG